MSSEPKTFEQIRSMQRAFVDYLLIYNFDAEKAKKAAGYKNQSTKALLGCKYVRQYLEKTLEEIGCADLGTKKT